MRFLLLLLLPIFSFAQNGLVTIKLGGGSLSSIAWNVNGNSIVDSNFLGTTNSKDLIFKTKNTEAMRIDTNGNVGIGTAVPTQKLYAIGGLYQKYTNGAGTTFEIFNSDATDYIGFVVNDTAGEGNTIKVNTYGVEIESTNGDVVIQPQLIDGNVGIGTSTPTAKLQVKGDVRIEGTDSVTIYAKTPANGTFEYCTNCSGNGITGRLLGYIGSAWRRFTIE